MIRRDFLKKISLFGVTGTVSYLLNNNQIQAGIKELKGEVEINGKELIKPIINTITKTFNLSKEKDVNIEVTPDFITFKKDSKFRVWVSRLRIRRKDNETD